MVVLAADKDGRLVAAGHSRDLGEEQSVISDKQSWQLVMSGWQTTTKMLQYI